VNILVTDFARAKSNKCAEYRKERDVSRDPRDLRL